jgi:hypothetical protein
MTEKLAGLVIPVLEPLGYQRGWCVIPNSSVDGVVAGVSVNVWNAKRHFLERNSHLGATPEVDTSEFTYAISCYWANCGWCTHKIPALTQALCTLLMCQRI